MKQTDRFGSGDLPSREQAGKRPYTRPTVEAVGRLDSVILGPSIGTSDSGETTAFTGVRGPMPPR
jgi:hypothetical protein